MKKIPAYFNHGEEGFEMICYGHGKDLLLRYFPDRLQILGFDTGEVPKGEGMDNWNVFVEEISELKEALINDVRERTGYKGTITLLQDDARVFKELHI